MKQGGRGVKTAYKDLKSKINDRIPAKGSTLSDSTASASSAAYQHHSAPNSPVFTKKSLSDLISIGNNSNSHRCKSQKLLQTSNSMMNDSNLTNHFDNNININKNCSNIRLDIDSTSSAAIASTANAQCGNFDLKKNSKTNSQTNNMSPISISSSPTSSLSSSSEMNILQELQQHALFKLPTVDRNVSSFFTKFNLNRTQKKLFVFSLP